MVDPTLRRAHHEEISMSLYNEAPPPVLESKKPNLAATATTALAKPHQQTDYGRKIPTQLASYNPATVREY